MTVIKIIGKNGQFLVGKIVLNPTEKEIKSFIESTGVVPAEVKIIRSK